MSKPSGKLKQRYLYRPRYKSKPTCTFHGPGNSSDKCKVLNYFGYKYTKIRLTKKRSQDLAFKNFFGKQQDNNDMVQYVVDGIILKEKEK